MSKKVLNYGTNILGKLDYSIEDINGRLELVREILNVENIGGAEFVDDYWLDMFEQTSENGIDTSHLKTTLNQDDMLYSDTYVAKILEIIGTYIINSPDIKDKEKDKETKIRIYHSKELFDRTLKEKELLNELLLVDEKDLSLDILVKQKNFKIDDTLTLTQKDIKNSTTLKNYNDFLEYLKNENKRLSEGKQLNKQELNRRRVLRKCIGNVKSDLEYAHICEKNIIKFKQPLLDSGSPDWSYLNMTDPKQVIELIKLHKTDETNDDLNCILMDLERVIKETKFTHRQQHVLSKFRSGMNLVEIAKDTHSTKQNVHIIINLCVQKIIETYKNIFQDWYYFNVAKGDYKRCSKCGEIKLTKYFYMRKNGYSSSCIDCNRK